MIEKIIKTDYSGMLNEIKRMLNLNTTEIANLFNINKSTASRWLNGWFRPIREKDKVEIEKQYKLCFPGKKFPKIEIERQKGTIKPVLINNEELQGQLSILDK